MIIGKKFNQLSYQEYVFFIDNHKNYTDFNTLGLYRSLIENDKLTLEDKIVVREYAHNVFKKTFDFLQLKDPQIFVEVSILGLDLTKADKNKIWNDVINSQQKLLKDKKIRHRNFGTYSKHNCGFTDCCYNGLMIRQNSRLAETNMCFYSDKSNYEQRLKSDSRKSERKTEKLIIDKELDNQ